MSLQSFGRGFGSALLAGLLIIFSLVAGRAAETVRLPAVSDPDAFRIAIVGLEHGHVHALMARLATRPDVRLVGIVEKREELHAAFMQRYGLDGGLFFPDVDELVKRAQPQAVVIFTPTSGHLEVVRNCAAHGIPVMMEKPLATTLADAREIANVARQSGIAVLINYEPTWWANYNEAYRRVVAGEVGPIRRMVISTGHRGPKEIGVNPTFLAWLQDPVANGDGALFDFGGYGAICSTWMLPGKYPKAVTAILQQYKPETYGREHDDSTVIIAYEGSQTVIQASWNWPFDRKDVEIYGENGSILTDKRSSLKIRHLADKAEAVLTAPFAGSEAGDPISHLKDVVLGKARPNPPSSLEGNLIAMEILDAAVRSAKSGRTIYFEPRLQPHDAGQAAAPKAP